MINIFDSLAHDDTNVTYKDLLVDILGYRVQLFVQNRRVCQIPRIFW